MKFVKFFNFFLFLSLGFANGCTSHFIVTSDPYDATIYLEPNSGTGERKLIGKTPLKMPMSEFNKIASDQLSYGGFAKIQVEKSGFKTENFTLPTSRFGTLTTNLNIRMTPGDNQISIKPKEEATAKIIVDRLFLAQKFALLQQFERAHIEIDKVISEHPQFARALTMRASIYYAQKNFQDAARWYEEALKYDPQMEDAVRMLSKLKNLQDSRLPSSIDTGPSSKR